MVRGGVTTKTRALCHQPLCVCHQLNTCAEGSQSLYLPTLALGPTRSATSQRQTSRSSVARETASNERADAVHTSSSAVTTCDASSVSIPPVKEWRRQHPLSVCHSMTRAHSLLGAPPLCPPGRSGLPAASREARERRRTLLTRSRFVGVVGILVVQRCSPGEGQPQTFHECSDQPRMMLGQ